MSLDDKRLFESGRESMRADVISMIEDSLEKYKGNPQAGHGSLKDCLRLLAALQGDIRVLP